MAARLTIIVPTPDGDGLHRLFDSIAPQLGADDEVLIIGDTHDGPLPEVESMVLGMDSRYRYLEHDAGHHCWGHCQINYGMAHATGAYMVFNDDDDIFAPGALDAIRQAIAHLPAPRPLMFKFYAERLGRTLPERYEVVESAIGGHCIVVPNLPAKLGRWGERYGGDFDFIQTTLEHWPEGPAWHDYVIAIAR